MPSFFNGKSGFITSSKGMNNKINRIASRPVPGISSDFTNPGAMIHSDDEAKVHVLALAPEVKGNQDFSMISGGVAGNTWGGSIKITKQHFRKPWKTDVCLLIGVANEEVVVW